MKITNELKKYYILIGVLIIVSVALSIVLAINRNDEGYQSVPSSNLIIDAHGVCKRVNNSGNNNITYFIPTGSSDEWSEFRESANAGSLLDITLEECGTVPEGIHIKTCEELQMIGETAEALTETYILDNNIDCSATKNGTSIWTDGKGFCPIGDGKRLDGSMLVDNFSGSFYGQGYSIMNLYINRDSSASAPLGLFGETATGVIIDNVHMTNIECLSDGYGYIGGLVGRTDQTVDPPFITVAILNCSVQGEIADSEGDNMGGLIGYMEDGWISNSSFTGSVTGDYNVGGLVGQIENGSINNCSVDGNVSSIDADRIGGLVGYTSYTSGVISIQNSTFTGNVSGEDSIGGIIGDMNGASDGSDIINCAVINSNITGERLIGGLIGDAAGGITITDSFFTGEIAGVTIGYGDPSCAGGLIGSGSSGSTIISNCYVQATISSKDNVGGFFGTGNAVSLITDSYFLGDLKCNIGDSCDDFGGLVGHSAFDNLSIDNCYAKGTINGQGEELKYAGGFLGLMYSGALDINNSYAFMDITSAEGYNYGGGLIGKVSGSWSIENSYSVGSVSGFKYQGGILGYISPFGVYYGSNTYWDKQRTNLLVMCGNDTKGICDDSAGKTTTQMRQEATYSGWDFGSIWTINEGVTYPCHQWWTSQGHSCF
jgi:trimeric autotransporter adhesin